MAAVSEVVTVAVHTFAKACRNLPIKRTTQWGPKTPGRGQAKLAAATGANPRIEVD